MFRCSPLVSAAFAPCAMPLALSSVAQTPTVADAFPAAVPDAAAGASATTLPGVRITGSAARAPAIYPGSPRGLVLSTSYQL